VGKRRSEKRLGMVAVAAAVACFAPAALADPIPEGPDADSSPAFIGHAAAQNPVAAPVPPAHPFMAPNERSNLHVDGFQTDTNSTPGPLGRQMQRTSTFQQADCASVTFDSRGRIVTICVGLQGPAFGGAGLYMFDRRTLATLAKMDLPAKQPSVGGNPFQDFSSGGYFYLDNQDRAVIPTTTRHVFVVGETGVQPGFALERDYDLSDVLASDDKLFATMPDWSGRIWFVSAKGKVGTIDPLSGMVKSFDTHEPIGNSFAVDETGGVFIVTDKAMYRFDASPAGVATTWREVYPNTGIKKPGQTEFGSGTTPTVMGSDLVAITDNADPMDVIVYKRDAQVSGSREVCRIPVFSKGASDTDQSLIATPRSIVVSNNYGYSGPGATENGGTTTPGLERVDLDAKGCHKVWLSNEISPSAVAKLSLANGVVYTYTKPKRDDGEDGWYFTAIDFATGKTIYRALGGEGLGYNNNYAPVTLGPDGTAYVGVLGGLLALRDENRPPSPRARPKLHLNIRDFRDGRLRLSLGGADRSSVKSVTYRRLGRATKPPFRRIVRTRAKSITATVTMRDNRKVTLNRPNS